MEAFIISFTSVFVAEMGDRTQLLSLILAARYRQPWPILGGVLLATVANHAAAGLVGNLFGKFLPPGILYAVVGTTMVVMAAWSLHSDQLDEDVLRSGGGAFVATLTAFFVAEIGDKTQLATVALAAGYANLAAVVAGTTTGMMLANVPVVFLGSVFANRLPMRTIHYGAALVFLTLGIVFVVRAIAY
jgi:putative Ca2+/H+ antiporter (TMEM165/GDT1 family)